MSNRIRTQDVITDETQGVEFSQMSISERVKDGLREAGYIHPTPIQLRSIPIGLMGADLIVHGKAGTGKTLIFTVLTLESIDEASALPQALILTATREIALQISGIISNVGKKIKNLQCHTFIGGTNKSKDKVNLKSCQVVVGSTGRIKDLCDSGTLYTGKIKLFFIDEVDALLGNPNTMGDINAIYRSLPERKQVCTFSATYTPALLEILGTYMRTPRTVAINDQKVSLRGVAEYYSVQSSRDCQKKEISRIIKNVPFTQCMIFSNSIEFAQELVISLCQEGITADLMSSKLEQQERTSVIKRFASFDIRVLVSSDVTARGIDMTRVNVVISTDIPQGGETYMHRIGRTGRYGSLGLAISVIPLNELETLRSFRKQLGSDNELSQLPTNLTDISTSYMEGVLTNEGDKEKFETHKQSQVEQAPTKVPRNARRRLIKKIDESEPDETDSESEETDDSSEPEQQIKRQRADGVPQQPQHPQMAYSYQPQQPPPQQPQVLQMAYDSQPQPQQPYSSQPQPHMVYGSQPQPQQPQVPQTVYSSQPQPQVPQMAFGSQPQQFQPPPFPHQQPIFPQPMMSLSSAHHQLCQYYDNYYRTYYQTAAQCLAKTFGVNARGIPPPPAPRF